MAGKGKRQYRLLDEPTMSDRTLLINVEDLINMAMGPEEKNIIHFKILQTVLHILARHMRMLEQKVEIRISSQYQTDKETKELLSSSSSSSSAQISRVPTAKGPIKKVKDRDEVTKSPRDTKKPDYEKEKAEKAEAKEKEKLQRDKIKEERREIERQEKQKEKLKAKEEREKEKLKAKEDKDKEKAEKAEQKEKERADKSARREKEKEEQRLEKAKQKDEERTEKAKQKEVEKAEKEKEKAEKEKDKERGKADKEKEKAEKEREKAEKEREKAEKERRKAEKEKEKAEKERERAEKERGKTEREKEKAEKEREKAEKTKQKERDRAERAEKKEHTLLEREVEKAKHSIPTEDKKKTGTVTVKEVGRESEKVLVVEKGPTTRTDTRASDRTGSIDVVTQSQFALLNAIVKDLQSKAAPLPTPSMPDNVKLREDLVKGSASLTDTMQAMQVQARIKAAEKTIGRMTGLLTQLASAGALPEDVAGKMAEVKFDISTLEVGEQTETDKSRTATPTMSRKSVAIDATSSIFQASKPELTPVAVKARPSLAASLGRPSVAAQPSELIKGHSVTHDDMDNALGELRDTLMKNVNNMTNRATVAAETASTTAKSVSDKLAIALNIDARLTTLYSLVSDYSEQLSGFDAGLATQMQGFQEQMSQIRSDLRGGLKQLEQVNNNAETAAVMELNERFEGLVAELDRTVHSHQGLTDLQSKLGEELRSLVECVEMLREQKSDRDEVIDGLRDKADNARLAGLLTEAEFVASRSELEHRIELCYDKFNRQEKVWLNAIKELTAVTENKAELMHLLAARDEAQNQLRDIHEKLHKLALALGEPKAAILTRMLARGATCGACMTAALMDPEDEAGGAPPELPALRPRFQQPEPCLRDWLPTPPDDRNHICRRWCGGSHTLMSEAVTREQARRLELRPAPPTKRFTGYGDDGRLYMLEEELQPCVECNQMTPEKEEQPLPPSPYSGGDAGLCPCYGS